MSAGRDAAEEGHPQQQTMQTGLSPTHFGTRYAPPPGFRDMMRTPGSAFAEPECYRPRRSAMMRDPHLAAPPGEAEMMRMTGGPSRMEMGMDRLAYTSRAGPPMPAERPVMMDENYRYQAYMAREPYVEYGSPHSDDVPVRYHRPAPMAYGSEYTYHQYEGRPVYGTRDYATQYIAHELPPRMRYSSLSRSAPLEARDDGVMYSSQTTGLPFAASDECLRPPRWVPSYGTEQTERGAMSPFVAPSEPTGTPGKRKRSSGLIPSGEPKLRRTAKEGDVAMGTEVDGGDNSTEGRGSAHDERGMPPPHTPYVEPGDLVVARGEHLSSGISMATEYTGHHSHRIAPYHSPRFRTWDDSGQRSDEYDAYPPYAMPQYIREHPRTMAPPMAPPGPVVYRDQYGRESHYQRVHSHEGVRPVYEMGYTGPPMMMRGQDGGGAYQLQHLAGASGPSGGVQGGKLPIKRESNREHGRDPTPSRQRYERHGDGHSGNVCSVCGATETSVWRQSRLSQGNSTVCNACGLYELKNGKRRPPELIERSQIKKQTRVSRRRRPLVMADGGPASAGVADDSPKAGARPADFQR